MVQNSARSIPISIPIPCLKTKLPIVKKYLFITRDITLTRVCLVKHLFQLPEQSNRFFKKANVFSDLKN